MIIDTISNAPLYYGLGPRFEKAFAYLTQTDFKTLDKGKYEVDGTDIIAIVNEYETIEAAGERMESHKKYADIQYIVSGKELIGHDLMLDKQPSKAYDEEGDYMLFSGQPSFFSRMETDSFAVFFPTDLHMPNIRAEGPEQVKKVVMKVRVD